MSSQQLLMGPAHPQQPSQVNLRATRGRGCRNWHSKNSKLKSQLPYWLSPAWSLGALAGDDPPSPPPPPSHTRLDRRRPWADDTPVPRPWGAYRNCRCGGCGLIRGDAGRVPPPGQLLLAARPVADPWTAPRQLAPHRHFRRAGAQRPGAAAAFHGGGHRYAAMHTARTY